MTSSSSSSSSMDVQAAALGAILELGHMVGVNCFMDGTGGFGLINGP